MSTRKGHDLPRKAITYAFLALAAFLSLFPFYFMFVSATHSTAEILSITPHLGVGGSLMENWVNLSRKMDVLRVCWNSLVMAAPTPCSPCSSTPWQATPSPNTASRAKT